MTLAFAQASGGEEAERIVTTFGVSWPQLLAQIASFCIVCLLLHRYAYRPILQILEVRRDQIAQGKATAEQVQAELARTEAQRKEVLATANEQASRFIEEAKAASAQMRKQEIEKAAAAAQQIVTEAREAATREHDRMLLELKHEVGRLVVQASIAVTGKILTPEDQRRLVEEAARQVAGQP
jgi:F-type H+-transporting ATPase subunit b